MPDIKVIQEDITTLDVDAIVNAANGRLEGGGGVDGAIHRAAGSQLKEACIAWKKDKDVERLPAGQAMVTAGFDLPARHVIHAVGPVWKDGCKGEGEKLRSCYQTSLQLAEDLELTSIAFPNISTGIYGFPKDRAVDIVKRVLTSFDYHHLEELYLVCFDDENFKLYQEAFS